MAEVLVTGAAGGREQAWAQAMRQSPEVDRVVVEAEIKAGLDQFSGSREKPFVVIGPEAPLVAGLADELRDDGYTVFGAGREAAEYEASKAKTVRLARKAGVTHPDTSIFTGAGAEVSSYKYIEQHDPDSYVIKEDGLRAGKGVYIPKTAEEAYDIAATIFEGAEEGDGTTLNFAKRIYGPEVSPMILTGQGGPSDRLILPISQDHKRALDGDKGPNTGGMGAYASVPESIVDQAQYEQIEEMADRLLHGIDDEGVTFAGAFMYLGLMMDEARDGDPSLLEINVRGGDPEMQAVLPLLTNAGIDVYRLFRSAAEGEIEHPGVDMRALKGAALSVCLATENYGFTDDLQTGRVIYGLDTEYEGVTIQQAGVKTDETGRTVSSGGRVVYISAYGDDIDQAADRAYAAIGSDRDGQGVYFDNMHYRKDIGWQARAA